MAGALTPRSGIRRARPARMIVPDKPLYCWMDRTLVDSAAPDGLGSLRS